MYVHYGCGHTAPKEWLNFDSSLTLRWEKMPLLGSVYTKNAARFPPNVRYGDISKGLPIPDGSCQGVFSSHVLEHLSLEDFHHALDNSRRMLREGGILRLVVPDLEYSVREYLRRLESRDPQASSLFMSETYLGSEKRAQGLLPGILDSLRTSKHQWMWDAVSLPCALEGHGFKAVRSCRFGDCEDPLFRLVENEDRFHHAIAVEARR